MDGLEEGCAYEENDEGKEGEGPSTAMGAGGWEGGNKTVKVKS